MYKIYILLFSILFFMKDSNLILFDFNTKSNISNWRVVDDVVMGGRSNGNFRLNKKNISSFSKIVLKVKGDGKKYQFRIKNKIQDYYSYVIEFETSKNW